MLEQLYAHENSALGEGHPKTLRTLRELVIATWSVRAYEQAIDRQRLLVSTARRAGHDVRQHETALLRNAHGRPAPRARRSAKKLARAGGADPLCIALSSARGHTGRRTSGRVSATERRFSREVVVVPKKGPMARAYGVCAFDFG